VPALSIVIVTFNARADVARCLQSLLVAPPATPHEIVVIDNASGDGTPELVRGSGPGVRLIAQATNLGFAAANNVGIRATTAPLILLLNSDTIVPPGAVDALVARANVRPDVAVLGPRLVDADGRAELSFGRMISPFNELRQKLLVRMQAQGIGPAVRRIERETRRERTVDWVSGACLLVRRTDAEAVGLLDERYFMYLEDVDFCAAIRRRGRVVLFSPVAEIVHLRGRSRAAAPGAVEAAYRRSHIAFYEKHHPKWAPWLKAYLRLRGRLYNQLEGR
jgi:GT2 family glycosyltransferase